MNAMMRSRVSLLARREEGAGPSPGVGPLMAARPATQQWSARLGMTRECSDMHR